MISRTTIVTESHESNIKKPQVSTIQRLLWLGNLIYHQTVAVLTVVSLWVFFAHNELSEPMLWHMVFSTIAYAPLMAVAIMLFSKDNLTTLYMPRTNIYAIHGGLLLVSFLGVTAGISVLIWKKNVDGREHFASPHALLGLISWLLVFCAVCLGVVASKTQMFVRYVKPVMAKLLHNLIGITAFVLGMAAIITKLPGHHFEIYLSDTTYKACYVAFIHLTILSLITALKSLYSQIKSVAL